MTLRRYVPFALAMLAAACRPSIPERTNATTVNYAQFDPANELIPLPNDIAIQSFLASDPGPAYLPCSYFLPDTTTAGLCAFSRAGGFSTAAALASIQVVFPTGTLQSDGAVAYAPSALDTASIHFAAIGSAETPNVAVVDATLFSGWVLALATNPATPPPAGLLVPVTALPYATATGTLTLAPSAGSWTAGHKYVALVRGYGSGVLTDTAGTYDAMPTLYILRQAVIGDLDLSKPENQALFPGDAAEKMAAGTQLEPLRVGLEGVLQITEGLALLGIDMPFADLVSMQSFQIAPGGTVTIAEGTDPADAAVTAGNTAALDAFTVQSSVGTATLMAVAVNLTDAGNAVAALTINAAPNCAAATTLGALSTSAGGTGTKVIPLGVFPSATLTAATPLYVCATASANSGTVTGTVSAVTAFTGTGYTSAASGSAPDAASATLTVN